MLQLIARIVREEVMKAVDESRRSTPGESSPGNSIGGSKTANGVVDLGAPPDRREPTRRILWLSTGRRGLDAEEKRIMAGIAGRAELQNIRLDDGSPGDLDAAIDHLDGATGLIVLPVSLDALGGVARGATDNPRAALILHALARRLPVWLVGCPLLAEKMPSQPGDSLWKMAAEFEDRARFMGATLVKDAGGLDEIAAPEATNDIYLPPGRDKPKILFYTERDIEDIAARGARKLLMRNNARLTPSARDRAAELGLEIIEVR